MNVQIPTICICRSVDNNPVTNNGATLEQQLMEPISDKNEMGMIRQTIQTGKGYSISAKVYGSEENNILIIASATGVKQEFYQKFAQYISEQGITVITFDYYGIGASLTEPMRSVSVNAAEWGSNDLEAVIQWTHHRFITASISLLGHSIGGQLIGLAPSATSVNRIVLVAAQTGYWRYWPGFRKVQMWLYWYFLFPAITHFVGYLPSKKFSSMENLPKQVALQWSSWCRNTNYLFQDIDTKHQYFHKITVPVIAFSIENDPLAPKKAVDWLTEKYSSKLFKNFHLKPDDYNVHEIGHFGVFKEKFRPTIWKLLRNELVL